MWNLNGIRKLENKSIFAAGEKKAEHKSGSLQLKAWDETVMSCFKQSLWFGKAQIWLMPGLFIATQTLSLPRWLVFLLFHPADLCSMLRVPKKLKSIDVAEVYQWCCLEESEQWIENVNQIHQVPASGKLVLNKILLHNPWMEFGLCSKVWWA